MTPEQQQGLIQDLRAEVAIAKSKAEDLSIRLGLLEAAENAGRDLMAYRLERVDGGESLRIVCRRRDTQESERVDVPVDSPDLPRNEKWERLIRGAAEKMR